jgi:hypothetical protein
MPTGCGQVWNDFLELHGSRGSTGWGPARITFVDMTAWQQVRGIGCRAWEVELHPQAR